MLHKIINQSMLHEIINQSMLLISKNQCLVSKPKKVKSNRKNNSKIKASFCGTERTNYMK